ncbi:hypothetical protein DA798_11010 [Lactobacillus sp. PFC-70]|nr:hypothetical protein DA798_11010 [Lactobacillus sp. PFC-70]
MSVSGEIKQAKSEIESLRETYNTLQKNVLVDSQVLSETKEKATIELDKLLTVKQLETATIEEILDWEVFVTNFQRYKVTTKIAQEKYQKMFKENSQGEEGSSGAISGVAAGGILAAAGMAAPSAAMALASTFGVASTGTAIASLSGAAATNATLALIGGGSMAAGSTVLGLLGPIGWGVGGAVALYSLEKNKRNKKKALAELNEGVEELKQVISKMQRVKDVIERLQYRIEHDTKEFLAMRCSQQEGLVQLAAEVSALLNTSVTND